jgi:hypothetical protein
VRLVGVAFSAVLLLIGGSGLSSGLTGQSASSVLAQTATLSAFGGGDADRSDLWRRTASGWEYANALDIHFESNAAVGRDLSSVSTKTPAWQATDRWKRSEFGELDFYSHLHLCLLAVALATFVGTLSAWMLMNLPNRAIENGTIGNGAIEDYVMETRVNTAAVIENAAFESVG